MIESGVSIKPAPTDCVRDRWTPAAFAEKLICHALAELAERVEVLPDAEFLFQHQAAHDEPRSATVDLVAAVFEREYWRRFPDGRDEDFA